MPRAIASTVLCLFLLTGCSSPTASGSPDPGASSAASPTAGQSSTPLPSPGASGGESTQSPGPGSGAPPIRGSAREIGLDIQMAPAPDGSLFVSIPGPGGAVLTRLDRRGSPMTGWAITVPDSTACGRPMLADDGTVRIVCDAADQAPPELDSNDMRAFAFDADGRLMAGWPVMVRPAYTGRGLKTELTANSAEWRVIGDALVYLELLEGSDVGYEGRPFDARVVRVAADGTSQTGEVVPQFDYACCRWTVGSDGVAYGVQGPAAPPTVSLITAIDGGGVRVGWPIRIEGIASTPAFALDGRLILTVALPGPGFGSSRVVMVDGGGNVTDQSAELLIETGVLPPTADGAYECGVPLPRPPINAPDGRLYVYGEIDDATYGLDASLNVLPGWPIAAGSLERPNPWLGQGDLDCTDQLAIPAAGPGGTVLLPLQARDPALGGGRLVSIGANGEPLAAWPVTLSRPGSEFWSVVVGADGTTYAVAIEPEAGGASSATVLAIAPDSTVIYATTVVDP